MTSDVSQLGRWRLALSSVLLVALVGGLMTTMSNTASASSYLGDASAVADSEDCGESSNTNVTEPTPGGYVTGYSSDFCVAEAAADRLSNTADGLNGCTITGATIGGVGAALSANPSTMPVGVVAAVAGVGLVGTCASQAHTYKQAANLLNLAVKECKQAGAKGISYVASATLTNLFEGWIDLKDVRCEGGAQIPGEVRFNASALTSDAWWMDVQVGGKTFTYVVSFSYDFKWYATGGGAQIGGDWSPNGTFSTVNSSCMLKYFATNFSFGDGAETPATMSGNWTSLCEPPTGTWSAYSF